MVCENDSAGSAKKNFSGSTSRARYHAAREARERGRIAREGSKDGIFERWRRRGTGHGCRGPCPVDAARLRHNRRVIRAIRAGLVHVGVLSLLGFLHHLRKAG